MPGSEQEIDGIALLVDGAIKIFALTFNFDIRFVKPPAEAFPSLVFSKHPLALSMRGVK